MSSGVAWQCWILRSTATDPTFFEFAGLIGLYAWIREAANAAFSPTTLNYRWIHDATYEIRNRDAEIVMLLAGIVGSLLEALVIVESCPLREVALIVTLFFGLRVVHKSQSSMASSSMSPGPSSIAGGAFRLTPNDASGNF